MKIACIGSRETPSSIILIMEKVGAYLARSGHIISTGNAQGADQAFARGANSVDPTKVVLFLPWPSYEKQHIISGNRVVPEPRAEWFVFAKRWHPSWNNLSQGAQRLHARNFGIVDECGQVICYPNKNKQGGGGTAMGMRIAEALSIPIIDLSIPSGMKRILEKIS